MKFKLITSCYLVCASHYCDAQQIDTVMHTVNKKLQSVNTTINKYDNQITKTVEDLTELPDKYVKKIDGKIDKYSHRITSKTEKTLTKLSRWENRIHALLQKVNPEAANRLFSSTQTTFSSLLEKLRRGKDFKKKYKAQYDEYCDKLTTSLKYLENQKEQLKTSITKPITETNNKMARLTKEVDQSEAIQAFIKERKKQLLDESIKYIGNSKYIKKINKEAYYYVETLKNYKQLFSDPAKAEKLALDLLNKIPAFQQFTKENSLLASLFGTPSSEGDMASVAGLQTRTSINSLVQGRIASGGPNAGQIVSQNLQAANSQIKSIKDKMLKSLNGGGSGDLDMPNFKPNHQKTKLFFQRIEYGSNMQFAKANGFLPTAADLAVTAGYKLNDKSIVGLGASYKLGFGSLQKIQLSHQGFGLRSFLDYKLKKQLFITGGFEYNYLPDMKNIVQVNLLQSTPWQQSGLLGISKKYRVGKKKANMQMLWDFLSYQQVPRSTPIKFRMGYNF